LKFTTGCRVSRFPSHPTRKKVEMELGKKFMYKGVGWKRLLQVKLMVRGKILLDLAQVGSLSATDLVVSLKPMGLHSVTCKRSTNQNVTRCDLKM
jgi:hypothetical protein